MRVKSTIDRADRRHKRVRTKIQGSAECPRLSVKISCRHIHVQMIDDDAGRTIVAASTNTSKSSKTANNVEAAKALGERLSALALEKGIKRARFDRGGRKYHGRVKAIAEAARAAGIEI